MGESKIINPKGLDVIAAKDKEELIIGEIDLNLIRSVRKRLPYLEDSKKIKIQNYLKIKNDFYKNRIQRKINKS